QFVKTLEDIITNIKMLENYLKTGNYKEQEYAEELVKKGRTILVYKVDGQNHFVPSRFSGYLNNTMEKHIQNDEKDGRDTNPVIAEIIGRPFQNNKIESSFIDYCAKLGVKPDNVKRRYWRLKDKNGKYLNISL
ncbi:MAG: hypothetical protein K8R53_09165, partial [Bacteroidales bacterium]|nr:hypothetical protein [Bacteroidales bacterium]